MQQRLTAARSAEIGGGRVRGAVYLLRFAHATETLMFTSWVLLLKPSTDHALGSGTLTWMTFDVMTWMPFIAMRSPLSRP